jgi:hypothetical protein
LRTTGGLSQWNPFQSNGGYFTSLVMTASLTWLDRNKLITL